MNAFSIDLEDWYHGIELPYDSWSKYEDRLLKGLDPLLELLDKHNTKATFFTLGWVGEKHPKVIKQISALGHEMASHGYTHTKVYDLSRRAFKAEVSKTKEVLEAHSGQEILAYRAPYFSITEKSLWALEILKEVGYRVDCSISPIKTWRYGIASVPDEIFRIKENGLIEFPASKYKVLTKNLAIGGAYFRIFPYRYTYKGLINRMKLCKANMFYIHPWEYDPSHPKIDMPRLPKLTHYTRLSKTIPFTDKLLKEFDFDTVSNVIESYKTKKEINEYSIEILKN